MAHAVSLRPRRVVAPGPHLPLSIVRCAHRAVHTTALRPAGSILRIHRGAIHGISQLRRVPQRAFHQTRFTSAKNNRGFSNSPKDPYDVLGVPRTATAAEIKKAYHKLALKYHPDQNKNDKAANDKLAEINGAYEILGNEEKRKQFDEFGHAAFNPNMGGGPEGFQGGFAGGFPFGGGGGVRMEDILRGFGFGGGVMDEDDDDDDTPRRRDSHARGRDIEVPLTIDFMDAVRGCEKEVRFVGQLQCKTCKGTGAKEGSKPTQCKTCRGTGQEKMTRGLFVLATTCRTCDGQGTTIADPCRTCNGNKVKNEARIVTVKVPAGVDNGSVLRVPNHGEQSANGRFGALLVRIVINPSELFRRDGIDVHIDVPITVSQAILGAKSVRIPTLRDGEVDVELQPGTQPETTRVLRGQGINRIGSQQRGNIYVHYKIIIPTNLSSKQQKLIEEFAAEESEPPLKRSFFKKVKDFLSRK